jgi:MoaD family protein
MAITIEIPQIFRKHTGGSRTVTVDGATIREAFQRLDEKYPGLSKQLLTDDGEYHRFINVYLNDEDIRYLGQLDTPLQDGDRVSILPAVAGGRPSRRPRNSAGTLRDPGLAR